MDRPPVKRMEVDGICTYLLGATLGEGSYGLVREGLDVNTAKVVAIKSLDRRLLKKQRRGLENLEREIRVHKRLGRHHTIVDLEDVIDIKSKSRVHLVLEYMHCGSVQDVLDRAPGGKLGQAQARRYFAGLLAGLQYIHSRGAVHKDIKPANMMLNRNGEVRLSDFGCAEELERYEASDAVTRTLGSPAFQSPEIARGVESFSGTATDVWAAGVTLFQMVVGRTPFDADNLVDLFEKIGQAQLELPDTLESSPALSNLLSCLLAPEAERLTVEQARSHPWMSTTLSAEEAGQEVEPEARQPTILQADFDALDVYPTENEKNEEDSLGASALPAVGIGTTGGGGGLADTDTGRGVSVLGGLFDPPAVAGSVPAPAATPGATSGGTTGPLRSLTGLFDPPGVADRAVATAPLAVPVRGVATGSADVMQGSFEGGTCAASMSSGPSSAVAISDVFGVPDVDSADDAKDIGGGSRREERAADLFAELGLGVDAGQPSAQGVLAGLGHPQPEPDVKPPEPAVFAGSSAASASSSPDSSGAGLSSTDDLISL